MWDTLTLSICSFQRVGTDLSVNYYHLAKGPQYQKASDPYQKDLGFSSVPLQVHSRNAQISIPGYQHQKAAEGRVLEIRQLDFSRSELNAPSDAAVRRWRLESHAHPDRRLDRFEVLRVLRVVLLESVSVDLNRPSQ